METALTSVHTKVNGVKEALSNFVGKMEHEPLTWCVISFMCCLCSYWYATTCTHIFPHTHTYTYAYTCTHTHTHTCTRPSVLDSFASVSSHTSVLMKQLCSDKMPPLHTRVLLPLEVSSDRDPELEVTNTSQWGVSSFTDYSALFPEAHRRESAYTTPWNRLALVLLSCKRTHIHGCSHTHT